MSDETDEGMHKLVEMPNEQGYRVTIKLGEMIALMRLVQAEEEQLRKREMAFEMVTLPNGSFRPFRWRWADDPAMEFQQLPFAEAPDPE
jgi:hypothetical protein